MANSAIRYYSVNEPKVVQVVNTMNTTKTALATDITYDDSIPLITEGTEVLSRAITPTSASNYLLIQINLNIGVTADADAERVAVCLFNTDLHATNAQAVSSQWYQSSGTPAGYGSHNISLTYYVQAPGTSETTFTVRAGSDTSACYLNGYDNARYYGGAMVSSITIMEIAV